MSNLLFCALPRLCFLRDEKDALNVFAKAINALTYNL